MKHIDNYPFTQIPVLELEYFSSVHGKHSDAFMINSYLYWV